MTAMMEITPKVNLLRSFRGTRVSYPHLIGEGIIALKEQLQRIPCEMAGVGLPQEIAAAGPSAEGPRSRPLAPRV